MVDLVIALDFITQFIVAMVCFLTAYRLWQFREDATVASAMSLTMAAWGIERLWRGIGYLEHITDFWPNTDLLMLVQRHIWVVNIGLLFVMVNLIDSVLGETKRKHRQ